MFWRRLRDQSGSQIAEFALIMPILLYLVFSVPVFGMIVRARIVVEGAAREAARDLAIRHDPAYARSVVESEIVNGGLARRDSRGTTLFDRQSDVSISMAGDWSEVTVTYRQPTFLPLLGQLLGSTASLGPYFTCQATARFRTERG